MNLKKRVMGIEPTYPAWKAGALPLSYTRKKCRKWDLNPHGVATNGF